MARRSSTLVWSARETAAVLGISERMLWGMTARGEIPHLRIGTRVLYPKDVIREWLREQARANEVRPAISFRELKRRQRG